MNRRRTGRRRTPESSFCQPFIRLYARACHFPSLLPSGIVEHRRSIQRTYCSSVSTFFSFFSRFLRCFFIFSLPPDGAKSRGGRWSMPSGGRFPCSPCPKPPASPKSSVPSGLWPMRSAAVYFPHPHVPISDSACRACHTVSS